METVNVPTKVEKTKATAAVVETAEQATEVAAAVTVKTDNGNELTITNS